MIRHLSALTLLATSLVASTPEETAHRAASSLLARRAELGLDALHTFEHRGTHGDSLGEVHSRFQQRYAGLKVWGGEVVVHQGANGKERALTLALRGGIQLNVRPSLSDREALAIAHQDLAPKGAYTTDPVVELVVLPETVEVLRPGKSGRDLDRANAADFTTEVVRHTLAYHVHAELLNGAEETRSQDYLVNAHTGAILKSWNTLHTAGAVGTGKSQWYGTVNLNTNSTASGFEMRDMTRGTGGTFGNNVTTNLNNGTSGNGSIFTDADNAWGDGLQYNGTAGTSANAQTAAVDAHRGLQATWDFYKNVFGRNGIDNTGKATYNRMHYSTQYDNAFWQDSCFCMTYGDGATGGSVGEADLDTAGHEMTHGVCATTANLTYSGESGGLNESNSDIFGTCVEFYVLGAGGAGSVVPDNAGSGAITANYTMFENSWGHPGTALRYMYKPSKDGGSKDAWSSTLGSLDVHYSSGPNNRMFYFLARGASNVSTSDFYSSYLPGGMTGIGNDKAARIWYRALTVYLTSSSNYAAARTACINAAKDLYGAGSAEEQAVWNAYAAINVGAKWSGTTNTVTATISAPASNITVASGTAVSFAGSATDSSTSATLTYAWTFGDGGTATGTSASHAFTNTGTSNVTYTVTFKATDNTGASGTATRTVTVTPAPSTALSAAITSPAANPVSVTSGTAVSFTGAGSGGTSPYTYTWSFGDGGTATGASATHTFPLQGGDASASYTVTLTVKDAANATATATRTVIVNPIVSNPELVTNGGFEGGSTGWTTTASVIGAYTPHGGTQNAYLCGYGSAHTDYAYQQIAIPSTATGALTFWMSITTSETTTTTAYDTMKVQVLNTSGTVLATLATYSNLNKTTGYVQKSLDLSAYKGQTIRLRFYGVEDSSLATSFKIDDISVK